MSSKDLAISVRNVSKSFVIAHGQAGPSTLREAVGAMLRRPFRNGQANGDGHAEVTRETFWALRDVNFDLERGQVLGLIGRNGAGKSTLLKILSRITDPTTGSVDVFGRVASLIEVGTGFHPDLTGRENIFLNGTILGMRHKEVAKQFDAIVDFAGVEAFLDTPVKHYSSGMYMRLAFAVAAHLEPEILLVDEVLTVGDAEFQRKCLDKIQQVAQQDGRTIILVSHTMASVEALCDHAIWLDRGRVIRQGSAREIVTHYLMTAAPQVVDGTKLGELTNRTGNGKVRFTSFHIEDEMGNTVTHVASGRDITFVFGYEAEGDGIFDGVDVGFSVHARQDLTLFVLYSSYVGPPLRTEGPVGTFRCTIRRLPLPPGRYQVGARMMLGPDEADWPRDRVGYFAVEAGDFYGTGSPGCDHGPINFLVDGEWVAQAAASSEPAAVSGDYSSRGYGP
jgi:lipopolysaccharide transport system ATP-binding protein